MLHFLSKIRLRNPLYDQLLSGPTLSFFRRAMPRVSILDRYVLVEILQIFLVSVLLVTSLLMSVVLKEVVGELLGKDIELIKILQYLGYLLIEKLSMTIPLACLFSGILAAGRLSGDSEITAMRSAGISFPRIYSIFVFFGMIAMLFVAYVNMYYGPVSARAREDFENWLKSYHSLTLVKPGRFLGAANMDGVSRTGQDIYAENSVENVLKRVQIREWYNQLDERKSETIRLKNLAIPIGDGFITQILHAESGELMTRKNNDGTEDKLIRLKKGFLIERDLERDGYQVTNFTDGHMDYVLPPPVKQMGRLNVKPDNYTFLELFDFLEKMEKGGHEIDFCSLNPDCQGGGGGSSKLGEGMGGSGQTFTLPAYSEMELMISRMRFWIINNNSKVGKPGGPTREEFQQKVQLSLQLMIFLKDAEKTRLRFQVEIHKRLATPIASILFFFISFPLGLVVKRSGKGMGFVLALVVFLIYNAFLSVGLSQAYKGAMSPVAGAWLPDVIIAIMGLYIMSTRTDDFAPFAFLTKPIKKLITLVKPYLKKILKPLMPVYRLIEPLIGFVIRIIGTLRGVLSRLISRIISKKKA